MGADPLGNRGGVEVSQQKTFDITVVSHPKHGVLWDLVKQFGSIRALAREVGVNDATMGNWVGLRAMPRIVGKGANGSARIRKALIKLTELAQRPIEEIFPGFVREKLDRVPRTVERTYSVDTGLLEYQQRTEERLTLPSPEQAAELGDQRDSLIRLMKTLPYREREVIKLRYGLDGEGSHTLQNVADVFRVGKERIRQLEAKALRRLHNQALKEGFDSGGESETPGIRVASPCVLSPIQGVD